MNALEVEWHLMCQVWIGVQVKVVCRDHDYDDNDHQRQRQLVKWFGSYINICLHRIHNTNKNRFDSIEWDHH